MDVTTFAGAYGGLKAAKELLTAAFEAKVDAEAKAKILEAQSKLGEVQDTLFSLREQLSLLQEERNLFKQQLADAQDWKEQMDTYELVKTVGGAVVLLSKTEPKHFACPSCVNKRELHILQDSRALSGQYRCTGCGSTFPVDPRQKLQPLPIQSHWQV